LNVAKPYESLFPTVDSAVLDVLAGSEVPRSAREIARLAHRSHPAVGKVLERLALSGLVDVRRTPASYQYSLNPNHVAASAVIQLANLRNELFDRLREEISDWRPKPAHASIFGSMARADGDESSDIDILLVRPGSVEVDDARWRGQVDRLAEHVLSWSGNHAGIVELSIAELLATRGRSAAVLKEAQRDGVLLVGVPVRRLAAESA
jgi:predicted nucleotidyltransferase